MKTIERRIAAVEARTSARIGDGVPQFYTCPIGTDVEEFRRECGVKAAGRHFFVVTFVGPDGGGKPKPNGTDILLKRSDADL